MSENNDTSTKNNDKSGSTILDLESLREKYKNLLIEYQQAMANYINFLQKESIEQNNPFIELKGKVFLGSSDAGSQTLETIEECKALCVSNSVCSGATFNPDNKSCSIRSGNGNPIPGLTNDYAIIPEKINLILILKDLNSQLININTTIQNNINNGQSEYNLNSESIELRSTTLKEKYKSLIEERDKTDKIIREYEDLDQNQIDGNLHINKNYNSFILLSILSVVFIFILYKFFSSTNKINTNIQHGGKLVFNNYYIIFLIIILLSSIYVYYYNK